jgi:hypothetical protein
LKTAFPTSDRRGESALNMTEQLAVEEFLGHGRAVDGDERFFGPVTLQMYRSRQKLLARAGLTGYENCTVGPGDSFRFLENAIQRI